MMSARHRLISIALLCLLMVACASPGGRLQTAGAAQVFDLQFASSLDWARLRGSRQELWTIDGLPLNQLRIVSAVKSGEHVFLAGKARKRQPDGPWFRSGMRPDEIRDVILDALRGEGWNGVEARQLRPANIGAISGLRFQLFATSDAGLIYRGEVAAAEREGRLTLLVWLAPAEHYYPRDAEAIARMFDSLRFLP